MNWMVRNLAALLLGGLTSGFAVGYFLYIEARDGQTLFSYNGQTWLGFTFLAWIPLGAIVAGALGALGYLGGALALRLRPAAISLAVILVLAWGVVFVAQSAEYAMYMQGWPQPDGGPTKNLARFTCFLGSSVKHSPLHFWSSDSDDGDSDTPPAFFSASRSPWTPQVTQSGDARVDGIGGGVQGVMASQDVSQTAAGKKLSAVSQWWDALRAHLHAHSAEWWLLGWQTAGFALGGLASIFYLRSFPFCKDCMLLLATKGEKTRYFSRTRDMRTAVDDVLGKARDKQLQQAVHAHQAKGADHDGNWSEFCSTMEIRRCLSCRVHRLSFHARRKEKERWKNIEVLAYTTTTLEPLDFA